jgi:hypothetical protein
VLRRVVLRLIHPEDDGDVLILGGSRDDHLPRARLKMLLRIAALCESPRRLDYDIDPQLLPWKLRGICLSENSDLPAIHDEPGGSWGHSTRECPMHRVIFEEVGEGPIVREIVYRNELKVIPFRFKRGPQDKASDSTESVDGYTN